MLKIYSRIILSDIISIITKLKKTNFYLRFQKREKFEKFFGCFKNISQIYVLKVKKSTRIVQIRHLEKDSMKETVYLSHTEIILSLDSNLNIN